MVIEKKQTTMLRLPRSLRYHNYSHYHFKDTKMSLLPLTKPACRALEKRYTAPNRLGSNHALEVSLRGLEPSRVPIPGQYLTSL